MPYIGNVTTSSNVNGSQINNGTITGDKLSQPFDYDSATLYLDPVNNRVGIGTSSPSQPLHVAGNIFTTGSISVDATTASIYTSSTGVTTFRHITDTSGALLSVDGSWPIRFNTNGTERLRIDSSGRVGIGTSSPNYKLDVAGAADSVSIGTSLAYGVAGPVYSAFRFNNSSFAGGASEIRNIADGATTVGSRLAFFTSQTGTATLTERLRINEIGNVGIGTTSPGYALDVQIATSSANTGARIYNSTAGTGNSASLSFSIANSFSSTNQHAAIQAISEVSTNTLTSLAFLTSGGSNAGNATERMRIDSSGRLLVGTSTARGNFFNTTIAPGFQLEGTSTTNSSNRFSSVVFGDGGSPGPIIALGKHRSSSVGGTTVVASGDEMGQISFQGSDGTEFVEGANIRAEVDGTPGANDMPGRLVFSTTADGAANPTERMRIDSAGRVTVNADFWILGPQINFDNAGSTIEFVNRNSGGAKTFQWYVGASGTPPIATLTTAGVWTNASDAKNKENIEDIAYGIETIKSLRPRQFDVKSDGSHNIGFIAQEVKPLVPEVVHESIISETGESHLGLDYGSLTAILTKALQESLVKIEALEARLTAAGIV